MVEIDPITGLPKELSVWENITKTRFMMLIGFIDTFDYVISVF